MTADLRGTAAIFDSLAADYDATFTNGIIGRCMRGAVWRRLDANFPSGARVLELGCGTGEDAIHLAQRGARVLATDASPAMVDAAARKAAAHGVADRIEARTLTLEAFAAWDDGDRFTGGAGTKFDGAFSTFGALNCVADLSAVARALGANVTAGAPVVVTAMGPLCPWEWAWFLARARPDRAFRRLDPSGARWRGAVIRYPSVGRLRRVFAPWFEAVRASAVGALVPPSYAESWAARHPRWLARLDAAERRLERVFPLPWLADHYVLELVRR